jgi:hypothetical protein
MIFSLGFCAVLSAVLGWPLCWNLRCAACQASTVVPLRRLLGRSPDSAVVAPSAVVDGLMALEAGMTVVDVFVTHPPSSTTLADAAQRGSCSEAR